jgi:hypothetical protein
MENDNEMDASEYCGRSGDLCDWQRWISRSSSFMDRLNMITQRTRFCGPGCVYRFDNPACRIKKPQTNANTAEGIEILRSYRPNLRRDDGNSLMCKVLVTRRLRHRLSPVAQLHLECAHRRAGYSCERFGIREDFAWQLRPCDGKKIGNSVAIDRNLTHQSQRIASRPSMNLGAPRRVGAGESYSETVLGRGGPITPGRLKHGSLNFSFGTTVSVSPMFPLR